MRKLLLLCLVILCLSSCRGWRSEKPPVHLNPNLDFQASIKPQENPANSPENIVPWGMENDLVNSNNRDKFAKFNNPEFYLGKHSNDAWVKTIPIEVNYEILNRGKERYNIYCSMCHGKDGSGNGIVMQYEGWFKPNAYWEQQVIDHSDGKLFDIVSNGIRSMPGYSQQIKENDRWAIVAYIRAIQASNMMNIKDVPEDLKSQL